MIHSANVGDYKFPGGGVKEGETHIDALTREIREESGMSVAHIGREMGTVIEYDLPKENEYDVFKMTSHYYQCDVVESWMSMNEPWDSNLSGLILTTQFSSTKYYLILIKRLTG